MSDNQLCPCGSKELYQNCCYPLHNQARHASSPEELMRSRYSAFVKKQFDYIISTQDEGFHPGVTAEQLATPPLPNWLALNVIDSTQNAHSGTVTFKAWYSLSNQLDAIFEKSNFILKDGQWFYTDGEHFNVTLPNRNDPCFCNSGLKFKKCCSRTIEANRSCS
ncbi:YchJ family protein [Parashewanella tropica]|uniref:YchJ family protein n=1 Tax=Parashewanella tropica TaxID=2547970 RepID=UPI00105A107F|nr:YchJ family metal-binding protein [Parashewanella tropica]